MIHQDRLHCFRRQSHNTDGVLQLVLLRELPAIRAVHLPHRLLSYFLYNPDHQRHYKEFTQRTLLSRGGQRLLDLVQVFPAMAGA